MFNLKLYLKAINCYEMEGSLQSKIRASDFIGVRAFYKTSTHYVSCNERSYLQSLEFLYKLPLNL